MRKRPSKPYRFAAVENTAIDKLDSILATGLLTKLIRAKDGEELTVESLCKTHVEGRESLTKAMRLLVDNALVVKFKIQRAASETVEEGGQIVAKRGGSWYTTFNVDSNGFTAEEVAAMLTEIYDQGNVKAHRIEPEFLDPKKNEIGWTRPGAGIPPVGATSHNDEPWPEDDSRPTYGSPTVGPPTVGHPAAHIGKKTVSLETDGKDEMPLSGRSPAGCRQAPTGSRARVTAGSAASGQNGGQLSRQERDLVQAVRDLLPADLNTALDEKTPTNVAAAIVAALAVGRPRERTPEQLVEHRVVARWNGYWAERFYAGQLPAQPYGPLLSMLKDTAECGNIACEDRVDVHTGMPCGACAIRSKDRRAKCESARRHPPVSDPVPTLPSQRARVVVDDTAGTRPECDGCGRWLPADATITVCLDCQTEAIRA
ncbi:hypothetical protein [Streptomyces sp. NPDC059071]|uniref:hypothetical protein n=1 Tax=unclassified Streptomyces TaxID=2593676 RepID=UPI00365463D3